MTSVFEAAQAGLALRPHLPDDVGFLGIAGDQLVGDIDVEAELGGDDGLIAPPRQRLAQNVLAVARAVVGRGVEEGDPVVQRVLDGADRLSIIDLTPAGLKVAKPPLPANRPAAHAQRGYLDMGTS